MQATYIASSNIATNGTALGVAGQDVRVHKILIGLPVASGNIQLYNSRVAVGDATANLVFKLTQPSSVGAGFDEVRVVDFGPEGIELDGGNVQIDQTMDVTVLWDYAV